MDLHNRLFRVHTAVRAVLLVLAVGLNMVRLPNAEHPMWLVLCCAVMVVLTAFTALLYADEHRRGWVFVLDVAITVGLIISSSWVLGPTLIAEGVPSVAAYWSAAAPLAVAMSRGWVWSLLAAGAVSIAGLIPAAAIDARSVGDVVLLVMTCLTVGYFTSRLRITSAEREEMYAVAARMSERQRLARIVHDGVLQVLAMVEREGRALGPRGMRLARAAHDQEAKLRALLQQTGPDPADPDSIDTTRTNLAAVLDYHADHLVTIATPAGAVMVDPATAREIDAAITEALANVAKHAGPNAQAWVLLEREDDDLIISIRDNGVGGTQAEFAAAAQRGRMGMRHSIYGRLADLGGTATLRTAPNQGTEWEFRIPV